MRIGVVGGGIAGITCAYELSKESAFDITVFEKDIIFGGRVPKAMRLFTREDKSLLNLIEEVKAKYSEVDFEKLGVYVRGKILTLSKIIFFFKLQKILSKAPFLFKNFKKFMEEVERVDFGVGRKTKMYETLHSVSLQNLLEKYKGLNRIIFPALQMTFETDFSKLSAANAIFMLKKFLGSIEKYEKPLLMLEGGVFALISNIVEILRRKGVNLLTKTEVISVRENSDHVKIVLKNGSEEKFDIVVLATPLEVSSKLLNKEFKIPYTRTYYYIVRGTSPYKLILNGEEKVNLRALYLVEDSFYYVYPFYPTKNLCNLDPFFESYDILGKEEVLAMPRIYPNCEIPDLKQGNRIYICGDFYYFPNLESAVYSAKKVANMIRKDF